MKQSVIAFLKQSVEWVQDPTHYWQLLILSVVVVSVVIIGKWIRSHVVALSEPGQGIKRFSRKWLIRRSGRLLYPILAMVLLILAASLSGELLSDKTLVQAVQRVVSVWFLWVVLKAYVTNTMIRTVALWFLVPAALLQLFGLFEPTVSALDSYGFQAGGVRISAYAVLKAIFLVIILAWLGRMASQAGGAYIHKKTNLSRSTKELLIKFFDIALYAVLFVVALHVVGIDLTALAVFSGALGVGLGFGLQKIASNFVSGIILLSEKSINIGNLIEMNDGIIGHVRTLGARASIVETFDGREVMVPNEDFITSRVYNYTYSNNYGRIDIAVGVDYETDLDLAHRVILEAADEYEDAVHGEDNHRTECFLTEFGDSSVNFRLVFWLKDASGGRWRAKSEVMFAVWRKLKEHNISIPFPQRDLHIRSGLDVLQVKTSNT